MSPSPAQIFVSRHGARLDAADSNWQYTTATAYDTPLTYGGWTQATSLGSRIGSLIVDRLEQLHGAAPPPTSNSGNANGNSPATTWVPPTSANVGNNTNGNNPAVAAATSGAAPAGPNNPKILPPRAVTRKVAGKLSSARIVIHTSPFLRCIQTSIGVSAGISQQLHASLPDGASLETPPPRPLLRLDGWLGEWLCEDYFAEISPPPPSSEMIMNAKLDLMRPSSAGGLKREDTPCGGYKPPVLAYPVQKPEPIPRGHVSHAKEFIDVDYVWDSSKFGNGGDYGEEWASMHKRVKKGFAFTLEEYKKTGAPPPPGIRGSRPTSSSRADITVPTGLGLLAPANGGLNGNATKVDKEEGDVILIFVSHGAGCNAMIGALTNQPALMDIGLASLTMAVRREKSEPDADENDASGFSPTDIAIPSFSYPTDIRSASKSSSSSDSTWSKIAASYEVRITASTSHLRSTMHHRQQSSQFTIDRRHLTPPGSDMSRSPLIAPAQSPSTYRPPTRRNTLTSTYSYIKPIPLPSPAVPVTSGTPSTTATNITPAFTPSIALAFGGGVRRTVSGSSSAMLPSKGLWRPIGLAHQSDEAAVDDDDADEKLKILNFGGPMSTGTSGTSTSFNSEGGKPAPGLWNGGGDGGRELREHLPLDSPSPFPFNESIESSDDEVHDNREGFECHVANDYENVEASYQEAMLKNPSRAPDFKRALRALKKSREPADLVIPTRRQKRVEQLEEQLEKSKNQMDRKNIKAIIRDYESEFLSLPGRGICAVYFDGKFLRYQEFNETELIAEGIQMNKQNPSGNLWWERGLLEPAPLMSFHTSIPPSAGGQHHYVS